MKRPASQRNKNAALIEKFCEAMLNSLDATIDTSQNQAVISSVLNFKKFIREWREHWVSGKVNGKVEK